MTSGQIGALTMGAGLPGTNHMDAGHGGYLPEVGADTNLLENNCIEIRRSLQEAATIS